MTEKRAEDSRERDRSAVAAPQELSLADQRQARKDLWEALNKALYTLMVGHAAGLVTCLTLIKDYKENPQLKGLGTFIALFGVGLIIAVFSVLAWTVGRADYVVLPWKKQFDLRQRQPQLFWWTAGCALLSTILMAVAILMAVFKFGTL
jgi:hypothetical protein